MSGIGAVNTMVQRWRQEGEARMEIHTNNYRIAPLNDKQEVLELLKRAEASIAEMTGRDVTLIAYERNEAAEQTNPT